MNTKKETGSLAGRTLGNPRSSEIQKKLAGCVLSLCNPNRNSSIEMKKLAFNVLISDEYDNKTKILAESILFQ